ncbi:MAG: hypothetical protein V1800_05885 [Candidatus Latescibacterota bacterium]
MDISIGRDYLVMDGQPRFIFGGDFNYTRTRGITGGIVCSR